MGAFPICRRPALTPATAKPALAGDPDARSIVKRLEEICFDAATLRLRSGSPRGPAAARNENPHSPIRYPHPATAGCPALESVSLNEPIKVGAYAPRCSRGSDNRMPATAIRTLFLLETTNVLSFAIDVGWATCRATLHRCRPALPPSLFGILIGRTALQEYQVRRQVTCALTSLVSVSCWSFPPDAAEERGVETEPPEVARPVQIQSSLLRRHCRERSSFTPQTR